MPLTVRWTASHGAQAFNVSVDAGSSGNLASATGLSGTSHTLQPMAYLGVALLRVEAVSWLGDEHLGRVELKVVRSQFLSFEPGEQVPPPDGDLQILHRAGLPYGAETSLVVTRGGVPITDARVLLNGADLSAETDSGRYTLVEGLFGSMFNLGPVELRVISGNEELERTLTAPGTFSVLQPSLPARIRRAVPRSPCPGKPRREPRATLLVVAAPPASLRVKPRIALALTLPSLVHDGLATLYVRAVTPSPQAATRWGSSSSSASRPCPSASSREHPVRESRSLPSCAEQHAPAAEPAGALGSCSCTCPSHSPPRHEARGMDDAQLARLYEQYGYLVHRRCLQLVRRPEDAEDALQETFLRVKRYGPPRGGPRSPGSTRSPSCCFDLMEQPRPGTRRRGVQLAALEEHGEAPPRTPTAGPCSGAALRSSTARRAPSACCTSWTATPRRRSAEQTGFSRPHHRQEAQQFEERIRQLWQCPRRRKEPP